MAVAVGIDVAKDFHWAVITVAESGKVLLSRRVDNTPSDIGALVGQIAEAQAAHGPATVGIDVLGGIAALLEAMLLQADLTVVHVPGIAVNRARRATVGGERKSDPKDARVIADQVRMRGDLRPVQPDRELDIELRLLVGRRGDLVTDATRRAARLRDLLTSIHPGLERIVDVTSKLGLHLLTRYVTPGEIRSAGVEGLLAHLGQVRNVKASTIRALAEAAARAATAQHVVIPGERVAADLVRELAAEALAAQERLKQIDARIRKVLDRHPDGALILSMPGMGATLTAQFLAETRGIARFASPDQLASAAGLAPVLKQSGKVRYLQRATAGNKALKRVFYQSAFIAITCDAASRAFYERKRAAGKRHHQARIALARRRVNVLHAILRNRTPYDPGHRVRAAA